jgi:heme/copper-type cytochrome/quinol oxidase subunit 4
MKWFQENKNNENNLNKIIITLLIIVHFIIGFIFLLKNFGD